MTERFKQYINSFVFKHFNDLCCNFLNALFETALKNNIQTIRNFQTFHKTNAGQMVLSYIGPTIQNKFPETFTYAKNLNTFKHNLKEYCLKVSYLTWKF